MTDHDQFRLDDLSCYTELCSECEGDGCNECEYLGEILSK